MKNWIKYAKFEEKHQYINSSRRIYERAVEFFGEDNIDETMLIAFAKFEEGQKEVGWRQMIILLCLYPLATLLVCGIAMRLFVYTYMYICYPMVYTQE